MESKIWAAISDWVMKDVSFSVGDTPLVKVPAWALALGWYAYSGGWHTVSAYVLKHLT